MAFSPPGRKGPEDASPTASKAQFPVGTHCWAPHPTQAYVAATVAEHLSGGRVKVKDQDGTMHESKFADLLPRSLSQAAVANMDELPELNVANVLANVEALFGRKQPGKPGVGWSSIYSTVGPVLIAMNPCCELPLYGKDWSREFRQAGNAGTIGWAWKTLGPHCYLTVEQAYQGLRGDAALRRQSIVICGESGAGKTVTNRKMLEYLLDAEQFNPSGTTTTSMDKSSIAQCNVLLEHFGNAKTLRNDNSSRFGKYSQLHFDRSLNTHSFEIEHYLLERSRIVSVPHGERNYHIFHELVVSDLAATLGLQGGPSAFELTRPGSQVRQVDGSPFDDVVEFEDICKLMEGANFSQDNRMEIFQAVAAVMHLCEVSFAEKGDACVVDDASSASMERACSLLGVEADVLSRALTTKKTAMFTANLNKVEATGQRDAVAKVLYSRVFDAVVQHINNMLQQATTGPKGGTVGLLDIFGFEDMPINGLEQVYINLTNERIQNVFTNIMFERELQIYREEGIESAFDPGPSNWPCIELFTLRNPPGIVSLIADEVTNKAGGKDGASLVAVFNKRLKDHSHYDVVNPTSMKRVMDVKKQKWNMQSVPRYDECFQVRHYAGEVIYTVRDFVGRSRDSLNEHVTAVMRSSNKAHVSALFSGEDDSTKKTVGEVFVRQLEQLSGKLQEGGTLFTRCVKPNPRMIRGIVDRQLTLEQLVNGGVISVLEIRRSGFADRVEYIKFYEEFHILTVGWKRQEATESEVKEFCRTILMTFVRDAGTLVAFGKTRVFMKAGVLSDLRAMVNFRISWFATMLQRRWRIRRGLELVHKLEQLQTRLEEVRANAMSQGFLEVELVMRSVSHAETDMEEIQGALKSQRASHHGDMSRVSVKMANYFTRIPQLAKLVEAAAANVNKVVDRKHRAEEVLAQKLSKVSSEASTMLTRVEQLESMCIGAPTGEGGTEYEQVLVACAKAKERLKRLAESDIPELQATGPVGLDLRQEYQVEDPCPVASDMLKEAATLVKAAEQQANGLQRARFAFAEKAKEAQRDFLIARSKLEALQHDAQAAIGDGCNSVGAAMEAAMEKGDIAEQVKNAAIDVDGYIAAVATFVEAATEAERVLRTAEEFIAQRRAEEEQARREAARLEALQLRQVMTSLSQHAEMERHGAALLRALALALQELDTRSGDEQTQDAVERLQRRLRTIEEDLKYLGFTDADPPEVVRERQKVALLARWKKRADEVKILTLESAAEQAKESLLLQVAERELDCQDRMTKLSKESDRILEEQRQEMLDKIVALEAQASAKDQQYEDEVAKLKAENEQAAELQRQMLREQIKEVEVEIKDARSQADIELEKQRQELQDKLEAEKRVAAEAWQRTAQEKEQQLEDEKARRASLVAMTKSIGVWNLQCTRSLGSSVDAFGNRFQLLDEDTFPSVSYAVEALNTGVIDCPAGFCIVFSKKQDSYFLVYRQDKAKDALAELGIEEHEQKECCIS